MIGKTEIYIELFNHCQESSNNNIVLKDDNWNDKIPQTHLQELKRLYMVMVIPNQEENAFSVKVDFNALDKVKLNTQNHIEGEFLYEKEEWDQLWNGLPETYEFDPKTDIFEKFVEIIVRALKEKKL